MFGLKAERVLFCTNSAIVVQINLTEADIMDYYIDITWDETAGVWCAICDEILLAKQSGIVHKF